MSDFPFSIPRRGDADVVNGVSYAGDTLTLTRAEGSDLTTTIATSDPTKIENGNSKMEIATSNGACVFTPNGDAALTTTFAANGDIHTTGNVGIGTSSPQYELDVNSGSDVMLRLMPSASSSGKLILGRTGTTDIRSSAIEVYNATGAENNYMKFLVHNGSGVSPFETRKDVMTLLGNGNVEITNNVSVGNYIRPLGQNYLRFNTGGESGDDGKHYWYFNWYSNPSAEVNFKNLSGDNNCVIRARAYSNISDDRTKLNETPIENAMYTLKKLNPVTYDYYGNLDCSGVGEFSAGLVAQEVWYNCPELRFIISTASDVSLNHADISNDDWGTDAAGVNYTEIMPYMIKAIQDQQTTIEKLEERLAALENK